MQEHDLFRETEYRSSCPDGTNASTRSLNLLKNKDSPVEPVIYIHINLLTPSGFFTFHKV